MKRQEFIARAKNYANARGLTFRIDQKRGKGSHMVLAKDGHPAIITVPDHRELDRGTLRSIIRSAGLTVELFVELLK